MKKAFIAFLAILLLALAPVAFAEESNTTESTDSATTTSPQERMKDRMRNGGSMTENRVVVKNASIMKGETAAAVRAERAELRALGDELKACKGKRDDACEKKRTDAKAQVKTSLGSAADNVLELLAKAKARLSESNLDSKADLIAKLDAQIAAVTDAKAKAEALGDNSTRAEIKEASAALRSAVKDARKTLQLSTHALVAARFGGVIKMTEQLEARLERALAKLQEKGVDVSSVNTATFEAKLEAAKTAQSAAANLYVQAKNAEEGKSADLMKQATEKMREAHVSIKEAHAELRLLLKSLKEVNGGSEALAAASTEDASASAQ